MRRRIGNQFLPFSKYDVFRVIGTRRQEILSAINSECDDYILNVNKEEYIAHIVSRFTMIPLEIHENDLSISTYETQIPAEDHPSGNCVVPGEIYHRDVIKYHLPFTGNPKLLEVGASNFYHSLPEIAIENGCICFEIVNFNLKPECIKQLAEKNVSDIVCQNNNTTKDLNEFNEGIEKLANPAFDRRKQELLKKSDLMSALGVPIRKAGDTPKTFSVPAKRTKVIPTKSKPTVTEKGYKPEPTLDDSVYQQILSIIHDVGKQFERLPNTYSGKAEEHLRDHMLLFLEPNFEGSATGETFNKSGKTDILLRYEGSNVFIAELKYWGGKKLFIDTISQLLGYLTWRDSKAAIVIFVKNKDFSSALKTAKEATLEHPNCLGYISEQNEGWYHYRFHINDDKNREIKLAVMLFHIPK